VATIKTQVSGGQRRIITKVVSGQRRVSCSCCEDDVDECCVYPATCGEGPDSINFFGDVLEKNEDELSYGDLQNGVFLEDDQWAVYRNGNRTTKACLGFGLGGQEANVTPNLASSYGFEFTWEGEFIASVFYSGTLTLGDGFGLDVPCGGEDQPICGAIGQCLWAGGISNVSTQDFDEGLGLIFNKNACRWEVLILAAGSDVLAYKEGDQSDPRGSYEPGGPFFGSSANDFIIS
jgi:hypothetical protein